MAKKKQKLEEISHPEEVLIEDRQYWLNKIKTFANIRYSKNRQQLLQYAPESIKKDREVVMNSILGSEYFHNIDDSFKKDKEFVLEYMEKSNSFWSYISFPIEIQNDEEVIKKCLEKSADVFSYLPFAKRKDRSFVINCLKENGLIYKHIPKFFNKDVELAQIAFEQNISSIQYISKSVVSKFLKDKSIAEKMLEESLSYFEYLPLKMRNDKNFITPYITKSPGLIRFLGKQIFNDVEFVNGFSNTYMISQFSIYSYLAKSNLLNNNEFALKAISVDETIYKYIPLELKKDINFNIKAMEVKRDIYPFLNEDIKENIHILSKLFSSEKIRIQKSTWSREEDKHEYVSKLISSKVLEKYLSNEEYLRHVGKHYHPPELYIKLQTIFLKEKLQVDLNEKIVHEKPRLKI